MNPDNKMAAETDADGISLTTGAEVGSAPGLVGALVDMYSGLTVYWQRHGGDPYVYPWDFFKDLSRYGDLPARETLLAAVMALLMTLLRYTMTVWIFLVGLLVRFLASFIFISYIICFLRYPSVSIFYLCVCILICLSIYLYVCVLLFVRVLVCLCLFFIMLFCLPT